MQLPEKKRRIAAFLKMKMKSLWICGAWLLFAGTTGFAQNRDSREVDPEIKTSVLAVLDEFMRTFNSRDRQAHYATYHFPHYRLASGKMTVLEEPVASSTSYLAIQGDWHHSKWDRRNIVHASPEKVHVDTRFTRYREDGSVIKSYESLYILTFENGRWGIKMRSSFAE